MRSGISPLPRPRRAGPARPAVGDRVPDSHLESLAADHDVHAGFPIAHLDKAAHVLLDLAAVAVRQLDLVAPLEPRLWTNTAAGVC